MGNKQKIIGWAVSAFFALVAFSWFDKSFVGVVVMGSIVALWAPPIRMFVFGKTNIQVNWKIRLILTILLAFSTSSVLGYRQTQEKLKNSKVLTETAAEQRKARGIAGEEKRAERFEDFKANPEPVLNELREKITAQDWQSAHSLAEYYLPNNNLELNELYKQISAEYEKQQKLAAIEREKQQAAERAKKEEEEARVKREQAITQAKNRAYIQLEYTIQKSMNNPASYKNVETRFFDRGEYFIVEITFRGTNAFNAVVTNTWEAKFDIEGNIFEIIK